MDFYELVSKRCSVRSFDTGRSIPDEVLLRILDAGRLAPSASNLQPWRFHLVRSPEVLAKIHPCYSRDWIRSAPCLLIVSGKPGNAWVRRRDNYNSIETDLTIAMDHMILAAAYEGVGTCWIAAFDPAVLHEALGLAPDEVVFAFTPLGYAAEDYTPIAKNRKSLDEIAVFL
ncbi:MAG: nitroreductase [Chlorobiaceae bacterium]|nr:nitroreductase [Chlorobiaceae bacterium]